jgi:hypothetical protein
MGAWNVNALAFQPLNDDIDGISLFREDFVTKEHLASVNPYPSGVRVARIIAREFVRLNLSLLPSPDYNGPPGHTVVPEMRHLEKKPETKIPKQKIKDCMQKLAQISTRNGVYTPHGLANPVARPKT